MYIVPNNQAIAIIDKLKKVNKMEVLSDIICFSIPLLQMICIFLLPFCIYCL